MRISQDELRIHNSRVGLHDLSCKCINLTRHLTFMLLSGLVLSFSHTRAHTHKKKSSYLVTLPGQAESNEIGDL